MTPSLAPPDVHTPLTPSHTEHAPVVMEAPAPAPVPVPVPAPSADVPRDTTPTFELEMLVSGAVLFGLFQLTGQLETWVHYWQPHVGLLGTLAVSGGAVLGRAALYGLIACFVVHLAIRAYWVALVGANSVFPAGPRWDTMKQFGPMQTELTRAQVRPLGEFIRRADNAASIVFASGFVIALSMTTAVVVGVPFALLVWALQQVLRMEIALIVAGALLGVLALLQIGASLLDYRLKERLDPASRLGRAVRAGLRLALATSPPGVRSLWTVVLTNLSPKVAAAGLIVGALILSVVSVSRSVRGGGLPGASNFRYFAHGGPTALMAARYASLDPERDDRAPWIDTDVVTGPYLRLHIPYRALVHDAALPAACSAVRPVDVDDLDSPGARRAAEAVLRCAARVHRIALDGRPLDSLRLRFLEDPRANRRVFVAHVPVRGLAEGEHELTVWPAVRPGRPPAKAPYSIPFWR